jgi:hypothetical protein
MAVRTAAAAVVLIAIIGFSKPRVAPRLRASAAKYVPVEISIRF